MGIEPDIEFGNDCGACYPAGQTPKYLYASFRFIVKCPWAAGFGPPPPNQTFQLVQTLPCSWGAIVAPFQITYRASDGLPFLSIMQAGMFWFHHIRVVACETFFTNQLVCNPGVNIGTGGFGLIKSVP